QADQNHRPAADAVRQAPPDRREKKLHDGVDAHHRSHRRPARSIFASVEREKGNHHPESDQIDEDGHKQEGEGDAAHEAREWYKSCVRRLVLFDIDGTLISDGGASRDAFAAALLEVYGYQQQLRRYDFSGRTDPQIAHM